MTAHGVATIGKDLHVVRAVLHKDIVTGAMHSAAGVLNDLQVVDWKDMGRMIPVERNTVKVPP